MTVHILTDSSHYLDPAVIAQLNLHVLPLSLHLNQRDFREREEITTEALFDMLSDKVEQLAHHGRGDARRAPDSV